MHSNTGRRISLLTGSNIRGLWVGRPFRFFYSDHSPVVVSRRLIRQFWWVGQQINNDLFAVAFRRYARCEDGRRADFLLDFLLADASHFGDSNHEQH